LHEKFATLVCQLTSKFT
jgi:hypothetical protein